MHSIGIILYRLQKINVFEIFIKDLFSNGQIEQVTLMPDDLEEVISYMRKLNLDFDDSYQLTVSRKYEMTIVTFDKDFDIKGINKASPEEIIQNH